jgi:cobalt-zinc-cadmium efflux system membrane fusion protein
MNFQALLEPSTGWQITLTLFHVSWLGLVIAAGVAAGNRLLRQASANCRYWLNFGALLVLGFALPITYGTVSLSASRPATSPTVASFETRLPNPPLRDGNSPTGSVGQEPGRSASWRDVRENAPLIALCYLFGAAVMLAKLMLSVYGGHRLRAVCRQPVESQILELVARQSRQLGLRLAPAVGYCDRVAVPVVLGLLRPMILLPATVLTGLEPDQLAAVLMHELAHIRRYDHVLIVVQRLIEALLFFHPAVWYLSRCVHQERECCCDDVLLAHGADRLDYAASLLRVAELRFVGENRRRQLAVLAVDGDQPSRLRGRIERLLGIAEVPPVRLTRTGLVLAGLFLIVLAGGIWVSRRTSEKAAQPLVQQVAGRPAAVVITPAGIDALGIRLEALQPAPATLKLHGSLVLDPNRLARVHSRFAGEITEIGFARDDDSDAAQPTSGRPLRFGDRVRKGDHLAVIHSPELGEKKGELLDALKALQFAERDLKTLQELLRNGATAEKSVREGQRLVEVSEIKVAKAERTLRSWMLSAADIQQVKDAVERVQNSDSRVDRDESWASVVVVSPIDGMIVEKNTAEGDLVTTDTNLFQIADLSELLVWARVYEEDLAALQSLPADRRQWKIVFKANLDRKPIEATFKTIGQVIDPSSQTAIITGRIANSRFEFRAGEFITAEIDVPFDPSLVIVPSSALLEDGDASFVFVETDADQRQFVRQKVRVRHRDGTTATIGPDATSPERVSGIAPLRAGQRVVTAGLAELAREIEAHQ